MRKLSLAKAIMVISDILGKALNFIPLYPILIVFYKLYHARCKRTHNIEEISYTDPILIHEIQVKYPSESLVYVCTELKSP